MLYLNISSASYAESSRERSISDTATLVKEVERIISDQNKDNTERLSELSEERIMLTQREISDRRNIEKSRSAIESAKTALPSAGNELQTLAIFLGTSTYDDKQYESEIGKLNLSPTASDPATKDRVKNLQQARKLLAKFNETQGVLSNGEDDVDVDNLNIETFDNLIRRVDDSAGRMLQSNKDLNFYTTIATGLFSALVAVVIVAFFLLSFKHAEVRNAIFAGESGIQFVTLFSVVIAIILFGILKILDAKELSALLGGLSGFILGRGSNLRRAGTDEAAAGAVPLRRE